MTPISISPPLAHETADRLRVSSLALEEVQAQLRHRWGLLAVSWQGQSKGPVEHDVQTAFWQLRRLIERTRSMGLDLNAMAERFAEADENAPLPVWGVTWSTRPGTTTTAAIEPAAFAQSGLDGTEETSGQAE